MLTGRPFTKPIGKLKEGKPAKLAKSNKLSLQWEDIKPEKEWSKLAAGGAVLLTLGKIKKS